MGGADTYAMPVVISDENPPTFFLFHFINTNTDQSYTFRRVNLVNEMIDEVLAFTAPEYIGGFAQSRGDFVISSDNIIYQVYLYDTINGLVMRVIVFDALTEDGQTATSIKTFNVRYESETAIAIDSNDNLYLVGGKAVPGGGPNTNRVMWFHQKQPMAQMRHS